MVPAEWGWRSRVRTGRSEVRFSAGEKSFVPKNAAGELRSPPPPSPRLLLSFSARKGREVEPASSGAKVRNEWSCTSSPLIRLHGFRRDSFTYTPDGGLSFNFRYIVTADAQVCRRSTEWRKWVMERSKFLHSLSVFSVSFNSAVSR